MTTEDASNTFRRVTTATYERIVNRVIHWLVVIIIATFVFVLRLRGSMDTASVTALYGTILGHVGIATAVRGGARNSDPGGGE